MMKNKYKHLPDEMKKLKHFVGWRKEELKGKVAKLPFSLIDGQAMGWNQADRWLNFEEAIKKNEPLGFVLNDNGITCVDLDNAIQDGELTDQAKEIVQAFSGTYMELSQSGKGIHIFCKGEIPRNLNLSRHGIEMYQNNRYIALTGDIGDGSHFPISNQLLPKQAELDKFYGKWAQDEVRVQKEVLRTSYEPLNHDFRFKDLSMGEILKTMEKTNDKASQLLSGVSLTGDHSRDDFIFLVLARNYTGGQAELMKELFLMTPLNRLGTNEKRRDDQKYLEYLDKSIESVLELGHFRPFDWSRHFQYKQRMKAYERV